MSTIHLLKESSKGQRITKCGLSVKRHEVSAWNSDVTCQECVPPRSDDEIIWD